MKNFKNYKSTIVGLVINGFVIAWLYTNYKTLHEVPMEGFSFPVILLIIGLGFLFAPDKVINVLLSYLKKKGDDENA